MKIRRSFLLSTYTWTAILTVAALVSLGWIALINNALYREIGDYLRQSARLNNLMIDYKDSIDDSVEQQKNLIDSLISQNERFLEIIKSQEERISELESKFESANTEIRGSN